MKGCKFCKIIKGEIKRDIIWKDKHVVAFLGRPHHKGHVEVALRRHEEELIKLSKSEAEEFFYDMLRIAKAVKKSLRPDKLNYELFGNWVPHLHWHILPRFKGDYDWGNPPTEPLKDAIIEPKNLTKEELESLKKELKRIKS